MPYLYWSRVFTWCCFQTWNAGNIISHFGMRMLVFYLKCVSDSQRIGIAQSLKWLVTYWIAEGIILAATTGEHFRNPPTVVRQSLVGQGFLTIEVPRYTTLGETPLDGWSARRRDLYLTTHNTHKGQTFVPPSVFEPAVPASERQKTHTLDRADTVIGAYPPIWWVFGLRWQEREASLSDS